MLTEKAATTTYRYNDLSKQIKAAESRIAEIVVLKTQIINYSKTRDVYVAYRKAGYSKKFQDEHASDIAIHKKAKEAFDSLPNRKIPTIKALQIEYAELLAEKKQAYSEYAAARAQMREVLIAKANVDRLLGEKSSFRNVNNPQKQR